MCFRFLQVTWSFLKTGELPHHDHGHVEGIEEVADEDLDPGGPGDDLHPRGREEAGDEMSALIIFVLLFALMLTGMPVSISLGLTVLTFLFTMTQVPIESVALKLFTGIEKFEIMAIPFFILAGNFLTHGGVARRMINFATTMVGHWHGGLALAGVMACALFAAVSGSSPATVVAIGSIMPAGHGQGGLSEALRRGRHHHLRRARDPDPAVDRDGDVFGGDEYLGRRAVHGRRRSRPHARDDAGHRDLVSRAQARLSAHGEGEAGPSACARSAKACGACC